MRTRATVGLAPRALRVRDGDLALGDFLEGHRQVVLRPGLDEGRCKVVERSLTELVVVVVDLPCPLGRGDDERIARAAGAGEEIVDSWMHHGARSLPAALGPQSVRSTVVLSSPTA